MYSCHAHYLSSEHNHSNTVHRPLGGCYMYSTVHLDVIKYYICLTQIGTWITSAASGLIMVTFEIQWQWLWMHGDLRPMVLDFH